MTRRDSNRARSGRDGSVVAVGVGIGIAMAIALVVGLAACSDSPMPAPEASAVLSNARIAQIVASPDRSDADRRNDVHRKPADVLAFIGVRPGSVALDLSAGGGYTTDLIARAVGPTGRVYGQSAPPTARPPPTMSESGMVTTAAASAPASAPRTTAMALAERASHPATANIVSVVLPYELPIPAEVASNGLDLVTLMFNYHDLGHMGVDRDAMNRAVFAALKPGGHYVLADHSGRPGTGISESGTLHRIEEAFMTKEIESAGFKLIATGNFLRNPADPRDRNVPEPPMPKDEFFLKFVKP